MTRLIDDMTPDDVSGVALLEEECFSDPWSYQAFLEELHNPMAVTFVAIEEREVVGFINARFLPPEGYINNLAVTKSARRTHVADDLLNRLKGCAAEKNITSLTLEVREGNLPAIRLYQKHGFQKVGKRKGFYQHPAEDAVLMTAVLPNPEAVSVKNGETNENTGH